MAFAPIDLPNEATHRRAIAEAANSALRAETHNLGEFTTGTGVTSYTVTDTRIGVGKYVHLVPRNAAAAALPWYMSAIANGSATFTFTSTPSACHFGYIIQGVGGGQS